MADNFSLQFTDNSNLTIEQFEQACAAALEEIGQRCERYAVENAPVGNAENSGQGHIGGTLRQSITHTVNGYEVYIGSPLFFAPYVEYGTGKHADGGKGRQGWWVFVQGHKSETTPSGETKKVYTKEQALRIYWYLVNKAEKGEADFYPDQVWITEGQKPQHFLLRSVTEHDQEYMNVLKNSFKF